MAATNALPKSLQHSPCGTSPIMTIETVLPSHLYLWVFNRKPSRLVNIIEHRGSRTRERYFYYTEQHLCIPEANFLPYTIHSWQLPTNPIGTRVWLVYADSCDPHLITFTSAPWEYEYVACTIGGGYVLCSEDQDQGVLLNTFQVLQMGNTIDGDPALRVALTAFRADRAGLWRISNYCQPVALATPAAGEARIQKTNAPAATLVTTSFEMASNSRTAVNFSGEYNAQIGDTFEVQFRRSIGVGYNIGNTASPNKNVFQFA